MVVGSVIASWLCALTCAQPTGEVTLDQILLADSTAYAAAKTKLRYAGELAQRLTAATTPAIILDTVGLLADTSINSGRADQIEALVLAGQSLAQQQKDAMRKASFDHLLARSRYFTGSDAVMEDALKALAAQRGVAKDDASHPDPTRLFHQLADCATMLQGLGRDAEMVTLLRAAERLLDLLRIPINGHIVTEHMFSTFMAQLGDRETAKVRLDHAIALAHAVNNQPWITELSGARAQLFIDTGDAENAIKEATRYLEGAKRDGNLVGAASAHMILADAHEQRGDLLSALAELEKGKLAFNAADDQFERANISRELSRINARLGRSTQAQRLLEEAIALRPETASKNWARRVAVTRTWARLSSGDVKGAVASKGLEDQLMRQHFVAHSAEQARALSAFYAVTERELQLKILEQESELAARAAARDQAQLRAQRMGIGLISALLLVVGAMGLRQYRHSQTLRTMVNTDALTGTLSRSAVVAAATQALAEATADRAVALCVFDMDGFKSVNDQAGHAAGDQLLVDAVTSIRQALRREDFLGRLGGDEFLVVMPNTTEAIAKQTAGRLLAALGTKAHVTAAGDSFALTMSAGVAATDVSGALGFAALIDAADQALLLAKRSGKNKVVADSEQRATPTTDELAFG